MLHRWMVYVYAGILLIRKEVDERFCPAWSSSASRSRRTWLPRSYRSQTRSCCMHCFWLWYYQWWLGTDRGRCRWRSVIRYDQDAASYRLRCGSGGWAPKKAARLKVGGGAAMLLVSRWMRRLEGVMRGILSWNKQLSSLYGVWIDRCNADFNWVWKWAFKYLVKYVNMCVCAKRWPQKFMWCLSPQNPTQMISESSTSSTSISTMLHCFLLCCDAATTITIVTINNQKKEDGATAWQHPPNSSY